MEPIQHTQYQPRKKGSAKTNVVISLIIHALIFVAGGYWAAHEGVLGTKLKELSVGLLAKEKKLEKPKDPEKTPEPAKEVVKQLTETAKSLPPAPPPFVPPATPGAPAAAPAAFIPEGFTISQDAITGADPIGRYKQQVENVLRSRWMRPEDVSDVDFTAEVEMRIDAKGKITGYDWKKGSGNQKWDASVKKALEGAINRPPPKDFPGNFTVVFDVQKTEALMSRAD